jgi:hypothetical protein
MNFLDDTFSIVIVGRWNPSIFSPQWVKANLCAEADSEVTLAISISDIESPNLIQFEGIRLFPSNRRIEIKPVVQSAVNMTKCARVAAQILELLPHTPVTALGINFSFEEQQAPDLITSLITFGDAANINADTYQLQAFSTQRSFRRNGNFDLNLSNHSKDRRTWIDFNYHGNTTSATDARTRLIDNQPEQLLSESIGFIENVYNMHIDQEEPDAERA